MSYLDRHQLRQFSSIPQQLLAHRAKVFQAQYQVGAEIPTVGSETTEQKENIKCFETAVRGPAEFMAFGGLWEVYEAGRFLGSTFVWAFAGGSLRSHTSVGWNYRAAGTGAALGLWMATHVFQGNWEILLQSSNHVLWSSASPEDRQTLGMQDQYCWRSICCFGKQLFVKCLRKARRKKPLLFWSALTEQIYSSRWFYFSVELLAAVQKIVSDALQKSSFMCVLFVSSSEAYWTFSDDQLLQMFEYQQHNFKWFI